MLTTMPAGGERARSGRGSRFRRRRSMSRCGSACPRRDQRREVGVRPSGGSALGRGRPCGRRERCGPSRWRPRKPGTFAATAAMPAATASAVIAGVSVISVGSSAVVPNWAWAEQMVRIASTVGLSLSSAPPPPLTWRSTKPGTRMPPPRSVASPDAVATIASTATVADDQRRAVVVPAVAVEDSCAGERRGHTVSVTLRRCGGRSGSKPRRRESASTKA